MVRWKSLWAAVALAALSLGSTVANCTTAIAQAAPRDEATKREALEWLDSFARYQVLFHADDVKKLRERVETMSPEEAAAWWKETEPKRKLLASPEWSETERWLREFLRVQAKYSDEEIRFFQSEAAAKAKESPQSLDEVLQRVAESRKRLIAGSQAAAQTRKLELEANAAYRQEEVRQREAAFRERQAAPAVAPPAPPVIRRQPARYNEPLIDSLDVARWTILREVFPRW